MKVSGRKYEVDRLTNFKCEFGIDEKIKFLILVKRFKDIFLKLILINGIWYECVSTQVIDKLARQAKAVYLHQGNFIASSLKALKIINKIYGMTMKKLFD